MRLSVLVLIAVAFCCICGANRTTPSSISSIEAKFEKIDRFASELMKCRSTVPGLSLAVVHKDKVFARGYGFVNVEKSTKTAAHHTFPIGSLTKAFTSTILALLMSENEKKFTWNTKIKEILGKSFHLNTSLLTEHVTIKDLLCHRTGIPSYFQPLIAGYKPKFSRKEAVRRLRFLQPTQPFRTKFTYNNHLYMLAGNTAEKLSGLSTWEELVTQKLFRALNMSTAGFVPCAEDQNLADPYVTVNGSFVKVAKELLSSVDPLGPAGSVKLSATDAAEWIKYHLNANAHFNKGVSSKTVSLLMETYEPCTLIPTRHPLSVTGSLPNNFPVQDMVKGYGLAWIVNVYRGVRRLSHSGNLLSLYSSQLWLYPEQNAGIYSATNGPTAMGDDVLLKLAIHYYASDLLIGKEPWLNVSSACSLDSWFANTPVPPTFAYAYSYENITHPLSIYVGTYGHLTFGNITVSLNETSQELGVTQGEFLTGTLIPVRANEFKIHLSGLLAFWTFADGLDMYPPIKFEAVTSDTSFIKHLVIPMEDIDVTFTRGLKLNDLPAEKTEDAECAILVSSAATIPRQLTAVISLMLFIYG